MSEIVINSPPWHFRWWEISWLQSNWPANLSYEITQNYRTRSIFNINNMRKYYSSDIYSWTTRIELPTHAIKLRLRLIIICLSIRLSDVSMFNFAFKASNFFFSGDINSRPFQIGRSTLRKNEINLFPNA